MLRGMDDCSDTFMNEVCDYFESTHRMDLLRKRYPDIDYSLLCSILYSSYRFKNEVYSCLSQERINEKKMLIISDTHYGSIYQNMRYTYDLFDYAASKGIHVILHGGDIIDSDYRNIEGTNGTSQAKYFINKYPHDDNIVTYAILGNHDYNAICQDEEVRDILDSREDINLLGYKKAYLEWLGKRISIRHNIENYKLQLPSFYSDYLSFRGHSHFYHVGAKKQGKSEVINIPALCDEPVREKIKDDLLSIYMTEPGFLEATRDGNTICVEFNAFVNGKIVKKDEFTKVLTKKEK